MRTLLLDGPGALHWEDAPEPVLTSPTAALVRPLAVATCDLDVGVLTGRYPLPGPYPLGHEGVAEVVQVGGHDLVASGGRGHRITVSFVAQAPKATLSLRLRRLPGERHGGQPAVSLREPLFPGCCVFAGFDTFRRQR